MYASGPTVVLACCCTRMNFPYVVVPGEALCQVLHETPEHEVGISSLFSHHGPAGCVL